MDKVIGINSKKVDQQTVELLRELLEKAESGDLQSILFVDSYRDGTCGAGWAGYPDHAMIGKIEELKFEIFAQMFFAGEDE